MTDLAGRLDDHAEDRIYSTVIRVERLREDIAALNADIAEIYQDAKGQGLDLPFIKRLISKRAKLAKDAEKFEEQETIFGLYEMAFERAAARADQASRARAHARETKPALAENEVMDPETGEIIEIEASAASARLDGRSVPAAQSPAGNAGHAGSPSTLSRGEPAPIEAPAQEGERREIGRSDNASAQAPDPVSLPEGRPAGGDGPASNSNPEPGAGDEGKEYAEHEISAEGMPEPNRGSAGLRNPAGEPAAEHPHGAQEETRMVAAAPEPSQSVEGAHPIPPEEADAQSDGNQPESRARLGAEGDFLSSSSCGDRAGKTTVREDALARVASAAKGAEPQSAAMPIPFASNRRQRTETGATAAPQDTHTPGEDAEPQPLADTKPVPLWQRIAVAPSATATPLVETWVDGSGKTHAGPRATDEELVEARQHGRAAYDPTVSWIDQPIPQFRCAALLSYWLQGRRDECEVQEKAAKAKKRVPAGA